MLVFLLLISFIAQATRSPVYLVPGLMSSIIEMKVNVSPSYSPWPSKCDRTKSQFRAWLNLKGSLPSKDECYYNYLHGVWNNVTNKMENIPGIESIIPKDDGDTYAIDTMAPVILAKRFTHMFNKLISHLEKKGYKQKFDLYGMPYDWRSNDLPSTFYETFKNRIIEGNKNTGKKAVIVTHSMGMYVMYKALDYFGEDFTTQYIDKFLMVSAPVYGSALSVKEVLLGENIGLPIDEQLSKDLSRTIQSVLSLSPNPEHWPQEPIVTFKGNGKEYYAKDLADLFETDPLMKDKARYILDNSIKPFFEKYNWTIPFGVDTYCAYSLGSETPDKIVYEGDNTDSASTVIYSDGDKLVNKHSLEGCSLMTKKVTYLGKYAHVKCLESDELFNLVDSLVL
ncbi:phosphatidylcholine-sterol acyltransferase precursor, putative [Entamoeba invadens IP1]|uniref:Phosphatidylcholine-sterol acyltransferase, putative n=1 Tax=Entamoeba invadens IP1 TaxID=370355 RepID=A0A0A1U0T0_ENTIV|nr:phosphatidylcholine-sterol acyltransferase precursor, putative [Entamoeba invadens IP1]ELP86138.1 phosphatidylcholine-sterol acyltransferase precursor, putative [Entamoeba invadens IP1]|eukprot:XP_004185484.1 phosphatidylcholine-sterol acyltransferase precursor, putative [Entamoeba invadens IP1]